MATVLLQYQDFPLVYCEAAELFATRTSIFYIAFLVLAALYLLAFSLSLFTCNKLYGVELVYVIQLGYYSLIPINVYCPPFFGLEGLKYSNGYNPFFQNLKQAYIASNYVSLGLNSDFLSNVNLMLLPLSLLPLLYFPLKYIGTRS